MRVLVISDIHANLTALEAVLEDAGAVDATWCLGDLVGYGPDPNECIQRIARLPNLTCLLGNHDSAALGKIDLNAFNYEARVSSRWMQKTISSENMSFLQSLPEKVVVEGVTLAHGSPHNPVWEYLLDVYSAQYNFDHFDTQVCMVGHTHVPLAYLTQNGYIGVETKIFDNGDQLEVHGRAILNPGSVGQPRDQDPRASYAIYHPETRSFQNRRVVYDVVSVQERIQRAGLPERHASRLAEGW